MLAAAILICITSLISFGAGFCVCMVLTRRYAETRGADELLESLGVDRDVSNVNAFSRWVERDPCNPHTWEDYPVDSDGGQLSGQYCTRCGEDRSPTGGTNNA